MEEHRTATVYRAFEDQGHSFARTPDGQDVFVHVDRYRDPHLQIIEGELDYDPLTFKVIFSGDPGRNQAPLRKRVIRFLPRPTSPTMSCQRWMHQRAWEHTEVYTLPIDVWRVDSWAGVVRSKECLFEGKLGEIIAEFPPGGPLDLLVDADHGLATSYIVFRCRFQNRMRRCEDPRFLVV